jgi:hypothetical protein
MMPCAVDTLANDSHDGAIGPARKLGPFLRASKADLGLLSETENVYEVGTDILELRQQSYNRASMGPLGEKPKE